MFDRARSRAFGAERPPLRLGVGVAAAAIAIATATIYPLKAVAPAVSLSVDARIGRGRSYRDALRHLLAEEHFDRIIVSATDSPRNGLTYDDLEWLLQKVPAEIMILRPAPEDTRHISGAGVSGHF